MTFFYEDHASYLKNPLIAESLYLAHYIERMGTGIQDITRRCIEYGLPEPEFKMRDGFVTVIYRKQGLAFDKIDNADGAIGGAIGGAIVLTDRQKEILNILKEHPSISYRNLSKRIGINESAVLKHLENLKKNGFIERVGGTRGYWKIIYVGKSE